MAEQLLLDLPVRTALGRDDFFVSAANAAAVVGIEAWEGWPHGKTVLVGAEASGKTHLAHVWAAMTGAMVVDAATLADLSPDEAGLAGARMRRETEKPTVEETRYLATKLNPGYKSDNM